MLDNKLLIELYEKGYNSDMIAKELGVNRTTIYKHLSKLGLKSHNKKPLNPRKLTEEKIKIAIEMYYSGLSMLQIVEELNLNCTQSALRLLFINRNIQLRPRGKVSGFDEDYFEIIDDEHKAYWLGFIYADGNVHKNTFQIELKSDDRKIMECLREDLKSNNKLCPVTTKGKNNLHISFTSQKITNDLRKYGVVDNKTHYLQCVPDIPNVLVRHFIRGYFDGDGTVFINSKNNSLRVGFYGTNKLLLDIQERLYQELETSVNKIYEKVGCYLLSYARKSDIIKIYHYFYDDADIFLERKKRIFDENLKKYLQ